jgi:hypothetical protein
MLRRVALVSTDVSEERSVSIIRVTSNLTALKAEHKLGTSETKAVRRKPGYDQEGNWIKHYVILMLGLIL